VVSDLKNKPNDWIFSTMAANIFEQSLNISNLTNCNNLIRRNIDFMTNVGLLKKSNFKIWGWGIKLHLRSLFLKFFLKFPTCRRETRRKSIAEIFGVKLGKSTMMFSVNS
jgi:hypothetical protein